MRISTYLFLMCVACGCNRTPAPAPEHTSTPVPPQHASDEQPTAAEATAIVSKEPPSWRQAFSKSEELLNKPRITVKSARGSEVHLTAKNSGSTTLEYVSGVAGHIQMFQDIRDGNRWAQASWNFCGTGMQVYEIEPGESVDLVVCFRDDQHQERMLANFTEKGCNRAGMVVLATESEQPAD